jgi:hypothetical protein
VFGDNDQRAGLGGQAKEMRGEQNAIGIRVKKSPAMDADSFYTDSEYDSNIEKIAEDLTRLSVFAWGKTIVFPESGIGTGLALLKSKAPKTFAYLNESLLKKFNIVNTN